jgi:DNA-binding transcriptional ArsR family regulator
MALAHATRPAVFRLLVRQRQDGMPVGEIALRLAVPSPTLSFLLKDLGRAGLIQAARQHGRFAARANDRIDAAALDGHAVDLAEPEPAIAGTQLARIARA